MNAVNAVENMTEEEMIVKEYNLDNYDDDDEDNPAEGKQIRNCDNFVGVLVKPEEIMMEDDPFAEGPEVFIGHQIICSRKMKGKKWRIIQLNPQMD